ncbi:MAG: hypothetical protein PHV30_05450 [Candidatus Margulisbacteria bacterium]|nr:hypothetical protein [Candidatus Margulisiibacteriota bacterium]
MHKHQKAFIQLELLIYFLLAGFLIPFIFNFVWQELKTNKYKAEIYETSQQLVFVQDYLQNLCAKSLEVMVQGDTLQIQTSENVYETGLKNQAIYVKQKAYRYLTTDPVAILDLKVNQLRPGMVDMQIRDKRRTYDIYLWF